MRYFRFAKLVRDNIPANMAENKQTPHGVQALDDQAYITELSKKVVEEVQELAATTDPVERQKELADVQEVLDCLKTALDMDETTVRQYQQQKVDKNGGFAQRLYIEYVAVADDSPWLPYYLDNPDKYPEITRPDEHSI